MFLKKGKLFQPSNSNQKMLLTLNEIILSTGPISENPIPSAQNSFAETNEKDPVSLPQNPNSKELSETLISLISTPPNI